VASISRPHACRSEGAGVAAGAAVNLYPSRSWRTRAKDCWLASRWFSPSSSRCGAALLGWNS